jgi:DNA-binding transcriptional ArsR family regulator
MKLHQRIDNEKLKFAARKIKMLRVPDKIRIIDLLRENGILTSTEINTKLNFYQAQTSTHLTAILKYGILNCERRGNYRLYSVNENAIEEITRNIEELNKKI